MILPVLYNTPHLSESTQDLFMPPKISITSFHFYIIDDDLSFCKSVKRLLQASGLSADYFGSAASFLDSILPHQRGVAIIDMQMPDCDGFELVDKMKDFHYDMPFIMITGRGQDDTRDLAMQKGAIGFLQKPFNAESLLELFDKAFRQDSEER
jgi:FixJ family two-component response regulator